MRNIVVAKFGGSSLADSNQFHKVRDIVMDDKKRRYIIPSAPGKRYKEDQKITDLLYLCNAHAEQNIPFGDVFSIIRKRYMQLVKDLNVDICIEEELNDIEKKIKNGASADYTASRGEYFKWINISKLSRF